MGIGPMLGSIAVPQSGAVMQRGITGMTPQPVGPTQRRPSAVKPRGGTSAAAGSGADVGRLQALQDMMRRLQGGGGAGGAGMPAPPQPGGGGGLPQGSRPAAAAANEGVDPVRFLTTGWL